MDYTCVTVADRPDVVNEIDRVNAGAWPEFAMHDPVAGRVWGGLRAIFARFQLALLGRNGNVIAIGNTIPLRWDGTVEGLPAGWDGALEAGFEGHERGVAPNTLCALAAAVDRDERGKGFSRHVIVAMREIARAEGFGSLIAPVRPSMKSRYPLTSMERYVAWTLPDGRPFDPWVRVHHDVGADALAIADPSMTIPGSVAEWESWTEMAFPESGSYVVPGALRPVDVDREHNLAVYREPNVWMRHRLAAI